MAASREHDTEADDAFSYGRQRPPKAQKPCKACTDFKSWANLKGTVKIVSHSCVSALFNQIYHFKVLVT